MSRLTEAQRHRYAFLSDVRDDLMTSFANAEDWLYLARGTSREADAQAEYARADAALSSWLQSEEGGEWAELEAQQ